MIRGARRKTSVQSSPPGSPKPWTMYSTPLHGLDATNLLASSRCSSMPAPDKPAPRVNIAHGPLNPTPNVRAGRYWATAFEGHSLNPLRAGVNCPQ